MSETEKRTTAPEDRDATRRMIEEMRKSPLFKAIVKPTEKTPS